MVDGVTGGGLRSKPCETIHGSAAKARIRDHARSQSPHPTEPLYATLLAEGRIKGNRDADMYNYWSKRVIDGKSPTAREVSENCGTTIHAARTAVRRYKSGIIAKELPKGLAPKTVRNIHAMLHRALVDAVAWKYIAYNPASNIKPPKRPRRRRTVWNPDQIQTFLKSVQNDRFAAFLCSN